MKSAVRYLLRFLHALPHRLLWCAQWVIMHIKWRLCSLGKPAEFHYRIKGADAQ
ncbi:MAG: hypothetical protein PHX87_01035 [Candidatus Peribacteraceae bacterium]|nr:hypothetical protein [Candidatus Peribacteraceae bacterium]MDD5741994.1 hypothetical protein [Candidatus Peribacteraceae bacterium]